MNSAPSRTPLFPLSMRSSRGMNRHARLQRPPPSAMRFPRTTLPAVHSRLARLRTLHAVPPRGRGERDQRLVLHGKYFRCAKHDHLLPQCSYPDTVKCNTCSATGHISPACGRHQNVRLSQQSSIYLPSLAPTPPQQLAIAYDGQSNSQFPADGAFSAWAGSFSSSSCAGAFYTASNRPTPEIPL